MPYRSETVRRFHPMIWYRNTSAINSSSGQRYQLVELPAGEDVNPQGEGDLSPSKLTAERLIFEVSASSGNSGYGIWFIYVVRAAERTPEVVPTPADIPGDYVDWTKVPQDAVWAFGMLPVSGYARWDIRTKRRLNRGDVLGLTMDPVQGTCSHHYMSQILVREGQTTLG